MRIRIFRVLMLSTLVTLVFAPTFVSIAGSRLAPAPLWLALYRTTLSPEGHGGGTSQGAFELFAPVLLFWILLSAILVGQPTWPVRMRSATSLCLLSLAGPVLIVTAPLIVSMLNAVWIDTLVWAGTVTTGWMILLLLLTKRSGTAPAASFWALRLWLGLLGVLGAAASLIGLLANLCC